MSKRPSLRHQSRRAAATQIVSGFKSFEVKLHPPYLFEPYPHIRARCHSSGNELRIFYDCPNRDSEGFLEIGSVWGSLAQWSEILLPKLGVSMPTWYRDDLFTPFETVHEEAEDVDGEIINPRLWVKCTCPNHCENELCISYEASPTGNREVDTLEINGVCGTLHEWRRIFLPPFGLEPFEILTNHR